MKLESVGALWDLDAQRLLPALLREVFMEAKPQLADVNADSAVLGRAVITRLTKDGDPNLPLRRRVSAVLDGTLSQIRQESVQVA
ncbi:MAG TPA: hypothetical protein VJV22_05855 [Acidobacteriaceae bacterium]|nr:hypothetical protein [Acidobacteriaceae bacterium]